VDLREEMIKSGSPKGMPRAGMPGEAKEVREDGIEEDVSSGGRIRHFDRFRRKPMSESAVSKASRMASNEEGSTQMWVSSA
jgi:hypothetical protein